MAIDRIKVAVVLAAALTAGSLGCIGNNSLAGRADAVNFPMESNTIADIAEKAAPAVVNIEILKTIKFGNAFPGFSMGIPFGQMEMFFNGQRITPDQLNQQMPGGGKSDGGKSGDGGNSGGPDGSGNNGGGLGGNGPGGNGPGGGRKGFEKHDTGSGFIVRQDGYILTNAHVVGDASNIKVTLNDKRTLPAKVVGIDYFSDLAVVKVEQNNLPTLPMGTSSSLRPGDFAIAIGDPLGYDHTVTLGIISAIGRTVTDVNGNINFIQTDAAINPGNSGGPLLNLKGEVIGVNTAIRRDAQNIGFSIPIDVAKEVSEELIAHGKISRPWLGIKMKELDDELAKALGFAKDAKGVAIVGFVQGSPALAAGLKQGDIIQKIDGKEINAAKDVKDYVLAHKVGDTLHFLIMRNNSMQAVPVNIGNYPSIADVQRAPAIQPPSLNGGE